MSSRRFRTMSLTKKVLALGALATAVTAIIGLLALLLGGLGGWIGDREREEKCKILIETARNHARQDNFQTGLDFLNGQTPESAALLAHCTGNRDIDTLRREVELFKTVADYDQFKYVSRAEREKTISNIRRNLDLLGAQASNHAEFDALEGLIEDMLDRPETAVEKYALAAEKKPDYANPFNYWGTTIFRWRMGGAEWARSALEKFDRAIKLKPDYQWAYANKAAVHLELADDELDKAKPQVEAVEGHLTRARESFDALDRLASKAAASPGGGPKELQFVPPRIIILRARYHLIQGEAHFLQKGRKQDANESFTKAKDHLQHALEVKGDLVEAHLLLGLVYEHLSRSSNDPELRKQAVAAFRKAASDDPNHLEASRKLAHALVDYEGEPARGEAETQVRHGLRLVRDYRADLQQRHVLARQNAAKNWFARRLEELEGWEAAYLAMAKSLGLQPEAAPAGPAARP